MKRVLVVLLLPVLLLAGRSVETKKINLAELQDKVAGGWAGKMIGVSYGAPTEFRSQGKTYEKEMVWTPDRVRGALWQDDLYVQMSFMMTMDRYGLDAPAEYFAESFAKAGYQLWHANVQARKNFQDGIMPPASGSPEFNLHADDIDFQIEADYIGFMCPGMPQTANRIADKIGHIMNYGDGVYGGMFVAGLYSAAFMEKNIERIVQIALRSIPTESNYSRCIHDVITLHKQHPDDWRQAWQRLEEKWGQVDICGALSPFNIDAKLNGAYIVMGLLYGQGDFAKTMEISTRCGQDSDCNPSNAGAVIGVMKGYKAIAENWKSGIPAIADSQFIFTDYSFNSVVQKTIEYAKMLIVQNGGQIRDREVIVRLQDPQPPTLEISFPNTTPVKKISTTAMGEWQWSGDWRDEWSEPKENSAAQLLAKSAELNGAEVHFTFTGNGVVLRGDWRRDGGQAEVYLDGQLHRRIDTHYFWAREEKRDSFLWHAMNLPQGDHTVTLTVTGTKKAESSGTRVYITGATIFQRKP